MRAVVVGLLGLLAVASAGQYTRTVRYDGQKVFRCQWQEGRQLNDAMYRMMIELDFDIWGRTADHIDVRVKPEQLEHPMAVALLSNCKVMISDLEAVMAKEDNNYINREPKTYDEWFEDYHTYEEIVQWYEDLANTYSNLATFTPSIGKTLEGRDQIGFHFTGTAGSDKPTIYFQCQIHAREWISGATCGYVINSLLSGYGVDGNITALLDTVQFAVNPIQNPDGYAWTWSDDRLWRKNRNPNAGSCYGVDINRNYNDHWGQGGSSTSPCSDTYMGADPNSELETQNSIEYFAANAPIIAAIDWHSYSQLILRPYGWTNSNSPDEAQLRELGDGMAAAIEGVHGVEYTSQKSIQLYVTTGTASDWFYGEEATSLNQGYKAAGYTIELRDTGRYGFELPPAQIIPTGEECLAAILYFVREIAASPIRA